MKKVASGEAGAKARKFFRAGRGAEARLFQGLAQLYMYDTVEQWEVSAGRASLGQPRAAVSTVHQACFMALANFWAGRVLRTSSLVSHARLACRMP